MTATHHTVQTPADWLRPYAPGKWHLCPAPRALDYLVWLNNDLHEQTAAAAAKMPPPRDAVATVMPQKTRRRARAILKAGPVTVRFSLSDSFEPFARRAIGARTLYHPILPSAVFSTEFKWRKVRV